MPTWKKKDEQGNVHFQFLCSSCNQKKKILLKDDLWTFVRADEPVSCNDCQLQCVLTARQLWGAEDSVRYGVCEKCPTRENVNCREDIIAEMGWRLYGAGHLTSDRTARGRSDL